MRRPGPEVPSADLGPRSGRNPGDTSDRINGQEPLTAGEAWMNRALELAERGRCGASPNPMVGAVVLDANGALVKKAVDGQTTVCPSALLRPGVGQHYEKNVTTGTVTKYPSSSNLIVVEVAHSFAPPGFL